VANPFHSSYNSSEVTIGTRQSFIETTSEDKGMADVEGWMKLTRAASTNIYYLLTERRNLGRFHRNKGRWIGLSPAGVVS
jgi:hypothetical protein